MPIPAESDVDDMLAAMMAPPDARYLITCRSCRTVWPYKRDCKTTKAVRRGDGVCPECDSTLDFALDAKADGGDE